jgi:hypothetical protein
MLNMDDKKLTIRDILDRIPEPKVKTPTKICSSYNPDSEGICSYWRGRCDALMHSRASVERLGEDYFCPHMPNFHKERKKILTKKEISKKYWTTYWEEKLGESEKREFQQENERKEP